MLRDVPQLLKNVRFAGGKPLEHEEVQRVIAQAETELAGVGRLVIRPSGTEPVIRVMAEGDSTMSPIYGGLTPWAMSAPIYLDVAGDGWDAPLGPLNFAD